MKKLITITIAIAAFALIAYATTPIFACGENSSSANAKQVSGKSGGYACNADAAKAKQASATKDGKTAKTYTLSKNALAVVAKHDANCKGDCRLVNIHIEGMTCAACEKKVKAALMKMDGVDGVMNVSYTDKIAQVHVQSGKFCQYSAAKVIEDAGFKADIIPAVATSATKTGSKVTGAAKNCPAGASKACCAAKDKAASAEKKVEKKESTSL